MNQYDDKNTEAPVPQAAVSSISMTLGLFALGIAWRKAGVLLGLPREIGEGILAFTFVLWLFLLLHYAGQVLRSPNGAGREFLLQLKDPFFTLVPITTGLASVALSPYLPALAKIMLVIGVVGQLCFSSYHIGGQWQGDTPLSMETPAMYMPTVGANFASAIALGAFGENEWGYLFFGAGFLSWMSLESAYLFRLRTNKPMPEKKRPLMGIQLAPAFVGSSGIFRAAAGRLMRSCSVSSATAFSTSFSCCASSRGFCASASRCRSGPFPSPWPRWSMSAFSSGMRIWPVPFICSA